MALTNGPNLGLLVNGALGEAHYNELMTRWRGLDLVVQCAILDRDLATPPGSPADGTAYIVAGSPTGAWGGHATHLARWSSVLAGWEFLLPKSGWRSYVIDEATYVAFNGSAWVLESTLLGFGTAAMLASDTDVTLAANSDLKIATQKATKAYADALLAANDAFKVMGAIDASTNPNYPAADSGHVYRISVAGKIGGASGPNVEAGDVLTCYVDGSAAGTHAAVGANWTITQANVDGSVTSAGGTLTNHGVLLGKGTRDIAVTAALTDGQLLVGQTSADPLQKTLSGDATLAASGALTIANNTISNAKAADVPTRTLKGRLTAATGDPEDLTFNQIRQLLNVKQVLTDAATIAWDADLGLNARVTLAGNRTLGNPTNLVDGDVLNLRIVQDGTGTRTLAFASKWKAAGGVAGVVSTAAGAVDFLSGQYDATPDTIVYVLNKGFA